MDNIRLERVNDDNFYDITKLRVSKEQKGLVADNVYSLTHAHLFCKSYTTKVEKCPPY